MQKHPREIEKMLDRMHRQTRPWARVGVFVMQIVSSIIERLPMRQPMSEVEVMSPDMRNQQEEESDVNRRFQPLHRKQNITIGKHPVGQHLV